MLEILAVATKTCETTDTILTTSQVKINFGRDVNNPGCSLNTKVKIDAV